jgi:hypothetical protein
MSGSKIVNPGKSKMNRNIERLFAQKVSTFTNVKFNMNDPLLGILKITFKAVLETIRLLPHITVYGIQQLQVDSVAWSKYVIPSIFSADEIRIMNGLLDEILNSAQERCNESSMALLNDSAVLGIVNQFHAS